MPEHPDCPACHAPMQQGAYALIPHGQGEFDLCWNCQALWFDAGREMALSAIGLMQMFRDIHANHKRPQPPQGTLQCPRCFRGLQARQDVGRNGRFRFYACPRGEGRFMPFGQFLLEKGFVRPLTHAEITVLRVKVGVIRCNACGAPVDLQKDTACPSCHAPISILDPKAVQAALASYGETEKAQAVGEIDMVAAILAQQFHVPHKTHVEREVARVESLETIGRGILTVLGWIDGK